MMNSFNVKLIKGRKAPTYYQNDQHAVKGQLNCIQVNVTEKGAQGDLPMVDFILKTSTGDKYLFATTGRLVNSLAAVLKGVNLRNHGVEEL